MGQQRGAFEQPHFCSIAGLKYNPTGYEERNTKILPSSNKSELKIRHIEELCASANLCLS